MEYPHPLYARDESMRKVLRSELSREMATRLEGSFGTQKQHYSLSRIKARNRKAEILWDLLRNTYGKCRTDDRQNQKQDGKGCMMGFYENILPERHALSDRIVWENTEHDNKNGI